LPWGPAGPASYADLEKRKNLYSALDKTLDLCDAHDIRVVWSFAAGTFTDSKLDPAKGWAYGEEQQRELVANPDSRGRELRAQYGRCDVRKLQRGNAAGGHRRFQPRLQWRAHALAQGRRQVL